MSTTETTQPNPTPNGQPLPDVANERFDLEAARAKLKGQTGRRYWRTLEELADTPQFQRFLEDEFPNRSTLLSLNRRDLLKFMGASMALAGLSGCRGVFLPEDKVVPYVQQPEELVPGKPLYYASSMTLAGYATGILVEQHEGRPTKLEGNPEHPASLGSLDALSQAQILSLYDPDRSTNVLQQGTLSTWEVFSREFRAILRQAEANGGADIRILTGAVTSPTLAGLMGEFLAKYPQARWHAWEPVGRGNARAGAALAWGRPLEPVYNFEAAKVVVSLDGDFLNPVAYPGSLRYARDFSNGRRVQGPRGEMNRLYVFESTPTLAGAMADHKWPLRASEIHAVALGLAAAFGIGGGASVPGVSPEHFAALVRDLEANRGAALIVPGEHLAPETLAIVHAINERLGALGNTVRMVAPIDAAASRAGSLADLTEALNAGSVGTLLILGSNPVYTAPANYRFAEALQKARLRVHHGAYEDETSALCQWHLPATHPLEEWGDARAFDGTYSLVQPLIQPLFEGRSEIEVVASLLGRPASGYDLVRAQWRRAGLLKGDFEKAWNSVVHDGVLKGSESAPVAAPVNLPGSVLEYRPASGGLEVNFRPDPTIFDGRHANNGWLQELPKPLSKLTWDNVAYISPAMAQRMKLHDDEVVTLRVGDAEVEAAVFLLPGHPDEAVTVNLGYGREAGGAIATVKGNDGGGFNAYALRTSDRMWHAAGAELQKKGYNLPLAATQGHTPLGGREFQSGGNRIPQFEGDEREVVRDFTLAYWNDHAEEIQKKTLEKYEHHREQNLYPEEIFEYEGYQWGMTVDMNTCIGCNACVVACQAENNIPVVGKQQVGKSREMHWLRIDRYYSGTDENPAVNWQPMMCVHCEKAPCEPVCPVAATVHSHEGLNQMIYNRCVGTRYCSNNCPYKVRRFNYLNYTDNNPQFMTIDKTIQALQGNTSSPRKQGMQLLKMLNNPDVTVRGRGVMEKCTYCVQRINDARQEAKKAGRLVKDGEIVTACQQACPTQTIVFGSIADKESAVSRLRSDPRSYLVLEELQTRPRTSYLAKLRNPNPEIVS